MTSRRFRFFRISLFSLLVFTPFWALLVAWLYSGWHQKQVVLSLVEEGCHVSYADTKWWNLYRHMSVLCLGSEGGNVVEGVDLGRTRFKSADEDIAIFRKIESLPSVRRINVETRDRLVFPERMRLPNLRGFHLRAVRPDFSSTAQCGLDFPQIERISLWYTQCTDDVFSKFSDLSNLKLISLTGREFAGEFLKNASFKESLTSLDITDGKLEDQIVGHLSDFQNLTSLQLMGNRFSDKAIPTIKQLKKLETLAIHDTKVSFAGVCELDEFEKLGWLSIGTTYEDFLDDSIRPDQEFPRFPSLRVLWVDVCTLDTILIAKLSQYDKLEKLSLRYNDVAPDAQPKLQAFFEETGEEPDHRIVNLSDTDLINAFISRFKDRVRSENSVKK